MMQPDDYDNFDYESDSEPKYMQPNDYANVDYESDSDSSVGCTDFDFGDFAKLHLESLRKNSHRLIGTINVPKEYSDSGFISPDGSKIAIIGHPMSTRILQFDLQSPSVVNNIECMGVHLKSCSVIKWSPDSKHIVFVEKNYFWDLGHSLVKCTIFSLESLGVVSQTTFSVKLKGYINDTFTRWSPDGKYIAMCVTSRKESDFDSNFGDDGDEDNDNDSDEEEYDNSDNKVRETSKLVLFRVDNCSDVTLDSGDVNMGEFSWSPQSDAIASLVIDDSGQDICVWKIKDDCLQHGELLKRQSRNPKNPVLNNIYTKTEWSPDGTTIFTICKHDARLWNAKTGEHKVLWSLEEKPDKFKFEIAWEVSWSPDSGKLLVRNSTDHFTLWSSDGLRILKVHVTKLSCDVWNGSKHQFSWLDSNRIITQYSRDITPDSQGVIILTVCKWSDKTNSYFSSTTRDLIFLLMCIKYRLESGVNMGLPKLPIYLWLNIFSFLPCTL